MEYVTIKNGVATPIERKQLYYKDLSVVAKFNFKSTEQDINTTEYISGSNTSIINGISFPENIVPDFDYQIIKEYEIEYKIHFDNKNEIANNNTTGLAWYTGNQKLPNKEGNFYNTYHYICRIYKNKIMINMNTAYELENENIDFNVIKKCEFKIYRNINGKLIITTPYNKIEEDNFNNKLNIIYKPFIMLPKYESVNNKYAFSTYLIDREFNITSLEVNFIARNKITI